MRYRWNRHDPEYALHHDAILSRNRGRPTLWDQSKMAIIIFPVSAHRMTHIFVITRLRDRNTVRRCMPWLSFSLIC